MNKKKVYMILMIILWPVTVIFWLTLWIISEGDLVIRYTFSILAIISTLLYMKNRSKELSRTQKVILNVILWTVIGIGAVLFIALLLLFLGFYYRLG